MTVEGKIRVIGKTEKVSETFSKREVVVTTDEKYPQHISIQFSNDKCDLLDEYNVGDLVVVSINLRGREWTSPQGEVKYFNGIEGWRIDKKDASGSNVPKESFANAPQQYEQDDLPF